MNIANQIEHCHNVIEENQAYLTLLSKGDYMLNIDFGIRSSFSINQKIDKIIYHQESYTNLEDALNDWNNIED